MKRSETVRESRRIFLSFAARLCSSPRCASGSSKGLTCSELCGGTSWAISDCFLRDARSDRRSAPKHPVSIYNVIDRSLLHRPLSGLAIVAGEREAMPIVIIEPRMVGPVVIARPARFRPEQRVLRDAFRGQHPMLKLPGTLELVQIFGAQMRKIFLQHLQ